MIFFIDKLRVIVYQFVELNPMQKKNKKNGQIQPPKFSDIIFFTFLSYLADYTDISEHAVIG